MSDQHIENTRRSLQELGALSSKTRAAEESILQRAQEMMGKVTDKLAVTPKTDEGYLELLEERARLDRVIAQAQSLLG